MKAMNRRFAEIINGNKQFLIPIFQRNYSWTREQCKQLWNDILRASHAQDHGGHFMGSIVYVADTIGAAFQKWLIIDGQQRLTTLILLLIALRDHIKTTNWTGTDNSPTIGEIDRYFLKNLGERSHRRYKLVLRRFDNDTLHALIDGKRLQDHDKHYSERINDSYRYFKCLLEDKSCDLDAVYLGIARLNVVDVTLERHVDNPQLVFESMNSTGVDLTQSDLVRNYLLMGIEEDHQTRMYSDYWSNIESYFQESSHAFDSFLRDYVALQSKSTQQARSDRIYTEFKAFWNPTSKVSLEYLLDDMTRVARSYATFLGLIRVKKSRLINSISNVRFLGTAQALLMMLLFDCHEKGQFSTSEFVTAVRLIESYLVRRAILGMQTRRYWAIFTRIAHEIDSSRVLESLQVALASLRDGNAFPADTEFKRGIRDRDLYGLRICKYVLNRLENSGQKEPSPVRDYSIEHVMPQTIDDSLEWQEMLGKDWEDQHDTWLHRLGNLTLTAYNSEYSNKSFAAKLEIDGGFNQSAVRLNEFVKNQQRWTCEEIEIRGNSLADRAVSIWPHHGADKVQVQEARIRKLRERSLQKTSDSLTMNAAVRQLLQSILEAVRNLGDIIEVVERRSVCCYGPTFFAEILPMKHHVRLILPLEHHEVENPDGLYVYDTSSWKFVTHRSHTDCDFLVEVWNEKDIQPAVEMVRQAFNR